MSPIPHLLKSYAIPSLIMGILIVYLQVDKITIISALGTAVGLLLFSLIISLIIMGVYYVIRRNNFYEGISYTFSLCWFVLVIGNIVSSCT